MVKTWMGTNRTNKSYVDGVATFIDYAIHNLQKMGNINLRVNKQHLLMPCPCTECLHHIEHKVEEVQFYLFRNEIQLSYTNWTRHGEKVEPSISAPKPVNATTELTPCPIKGVLSATVTLYLKVEDPILRNIKCKYKTAQELWAAILKTFGGNETTKKTKKNLLKQQYGNFKAKGSETLEQTFNRLQAIIDEDNIEEMDIKWNMALLSMRADRFWKKTGKKVSIQGTDVAGFDKSKIECFNCHKMGHFARECKAPRSQDRGKRDNYRQGSKVEEQVPKALMAIDGVGWDWSFMANEEANHALVADEEAPTEFALMAKSSTNNEVFDNSLCSKACKKNTDSLNSKITELSEKLGDTKNMMYHYKLGLSHVEARLVEFKDQEINFCKKIRGLELKVEFKTNRIENLTNELETLKKEKEGLDSKLTDDTITDYSRPSSAIESNSDEFQNRKISVDEIGASSSTILSKPAIKFIKAADRPTESKIDKVEIAKKPAIMSLLMDDMCHLVKEDARLLAKEQSKPDPRQHNMYSIDLNNVVPHKDLTCLIAKASADECMLWHRRLGHLNIKIMNRKEA
nr:hypothetical protein [Tanacetum cinerariifolium]